MKTKLEQLARSVLGPFWTYVRRLRLWLKVPFELQFVGSPTGSNSLRKSIWYSPISSIAGLNEFRNMVLLGDATVKVRDIGVFHLRAHSDDLYVALPSSEAAVLNLIRSRLRPGETFVDAGANIGIYTIAASKLVGIDGTVVAIEMMPDTFARLRSHVEINRCGNVQLVNKAISDRSGELVSAVMPPHGRHGKASIVAFEPINPDEVVNVETQTLDQILAPFHEIALMKMDLEGAERLAIQGTNKVLSRIEAIVFERWDNRHDAGPLLEKHGFRVWSLDGKNAVAERS